MSGAELLQQIVDRAKTRERLGDGKSRSAWRAKSVKRTPELDRILKILQRDWEEGAEELAEEMTEILRKEGGTQKLWKAQAAVLHDLGAYGGAVGILRVSGGKTLISFLAPFVTRSVRPLLIVPGTLMKAKKGRLGKTQRDLIKFRQHWHIPDFIRIVSYEWLSRMQQEDFFTRYRPDLIILDEAHHAKNLSSVVRKRIDFYREDCIDYQEELKKSPEQYSEKMQEWVSKGVELKIPPFLLLSGTLTKDSILDYWHLLQWVLPSERVPLPLKFQEMISWSLVLDSRVGDLRRLMPGALLEFCNQEEREISKEHPTKAARLGYKRRLQRTPGIICTQDAFLGAGLVIEEMRVQPPDQIIRAFDRLRRKNETMDGTEIQDGAVAAQRAVELALGFYQRWKKPLPAKEWVLARKVWCQTCRHILSYNRKRLVSEEQVKAALDAGMHVGRKTQAAREALAAWRKLEKTYTPNVEAVWVSDFALEAAVAWAKEYGGLIWAYHPEVGRRLQKKYGIKYYHEGGYASDGTFIEDHPKDTPAVASIKSNMEGKNLQHTWSNALMLYSPSSGEWWEQIIGRLHREGQEADTVRYFVLVSCIEQVIAFWKARGDGEYVEDTALKHKLLFADIVFPQVADVLKESGSLWAEFDPALGTTETETETETESEKDTE